jgi:hypothetical protein
MAIDSAMPGKDRSMPIGFHEILREEPPVGKRAALKFKEMLRKKDYEEFVPRIEGLVGNDSKIRLVVQLHDVKGWTAGTLWEDTKIASRHFNDLKKLKTSGPLESKSCERMITPSPFGSANAGSLSPFFNALSPSNHACGKTGLRFHDPKLFQIGFSYADSF